MPPPDLLWNALTAASLAAALAVVFTAPPACMLPTFLSGLVAYLVHDGLAGLGMLDAGATIFAAAAAVLTATAVTPRQLATPVVIIAAIFPLSAGVAVFDAIADLLKVSSYQGAALQAASLSLSANLGRAFTTFTAIAFGLQIGIAIVHAFGRRKET